MNYLSMQLERDRLLAEVENLSANTDGHAQKMQDVHSQKLKILESQVFLFFIFQFTFHCN